MDKNEEINYWIDHLKILEDELHLQETMEERAMIRKDIFNIFVVVELILLNLNNYVEILKADMF